MDIVSLILGFVIGVVIVGIAVEFGTKKKQIILLLQNIQKIGIFQNYQILVL